MVRRSPSKNPHRRWRPEVEALEERCVPASWSGDLPAGLTTWSSAEVQRLTGTVRVPAGSTLVIEPNTVVKFNAFAGISLLVDGTLKAEGTAALPIVFTSSRDDVREDTNGDGASSSPFPGEWNAIQFNAGSVDNRLDHVEVRYGAATTAAVIVNGGPLSLSNSTLFASYETGLGIQASNPTVSNVLFKNNYRAASMDLASNIAISGVTMDHNDFNALVLDGGTLVGNGFWDDPDIVYLVTGNITVPAGQTLTVGAGQIVKFAEFARLGLTVEGTLNADGTASAPVVFTSGRDDNAGGDLRNDGQTQLYPGQWNGLDFKSGSTANLLDHVEVRYGGDQSAGAVIVEGGELTLSNSTILASYRDGLRIQASNPTISNVVFAGNFQAASMDLASNPAISGVTMDHNDFNALVLDGGALVGNGVWNDPDIVYLMTSAITVPAGQTLTVAPGQVVKFADFSNVGLIVAGSLNADGTAAAPVVFTSGRDDSAGGDLRNDGQTQLSPGQWNGLDFKSGSTSNLLDHVEVRYGGGYPGAVFVEGGAVTLSNSVVHSSADFAVQASLNGVVRLDSNLLYRNFGGVRAESNAVVTAFNNTIDANGRGVSVNGATLTLTNNLITNNTTSGVHRESAATLSLQFNDVHNPTASRGNYEGLTDQTGSNANLSADPKYVNASAGDYRLDVGSPVVDAGTSTNAAATDFLGNSRYDDPVVLNTGGGAQPFLDLGAFERQTSFSPTTDLRTSGVSGPAAGLQGQSATVSWTVENLGPEAAAGPWHDAIYLSADTVWTPDDVFLGDLTHTTNLAAGQSYNASTSVALPGLLPGNYYFVVRANSRNEVFEGLDLANNARAATDPVALDVPALTLGVPLTGQLSASGEGRLYKVTPPAGSALQVSLSGPSGAVNELYVSFGDAPTRQSFDGRGVRPGSADQSVSVADTRAGTYYVLVHGAEVPSAETFTLTAGITPFSVAGVSPTQAGNAGQVTLTIRGAQFNRNSQPRLIDSQGATLTPLQVSFTDSGELAATFDLRGRPLGSATVQVVNGGVTATLADAFTIRAGTGGRLATSVVTPGAVRLNRSFTVTVEYENVGDADLLAPVLRLENSGPSLLSFSPFLTDAHSGLSLIAVNPDGPAGVLPPGARGRITLYSSASERANNNYQLVQGEYNATPIDWDVVGPTVRPAGLGDADWDAFFAGLRANFGATWDQFHAALSRAVTLFPASAGRNTSLIDVLHAEVEKVEGQLTPSVSGRVFLGDTSRPLGNVTISLLDRAEGILYQTVSRTDGTFVVPDVLPATYEVSFAGFLSATPLVVNMGATSQENLSWVVTTGGEIGGSVVLDGLGVPQRGVPVQVASASASAAGVTDNDGRFSFAGLPAGIYTVTAGAAPFVQAVRGDIVLDAGGVVRNVSLALRQGGTISGSVSGPGGALAGAVVSALGPDGSGASAVTAADGSYTLSGLADQLYTVRAVTDGFVAATVADVALASTGVNLTLKTGGSVRGSLSAANVEVELRQGATALFTRTDADGQFRLTSLPAGAYTLRLTSSSFQTTTLPVTVVAGTTTDVTLTLPARGVVTGTALDTATGQPIGAVIVQARSGEELVGLTTTDAAGQYRFDRLDAGSYRILLGDTASPGLAEAAVSIDAGHTTATANLSVALAGKVFGTVFDTDGVTPLAGALVALVQNGHVLVSMVSDDAGHYSFVAVAAGTYQIEAATLGRHFAPLTDVSISGGAVQTGLDLRPASEVIEVTVRDAGSGQPLDGATVSLEQLDVGLPGIVTGTTGADGRFSFTAATAGSYRVRAAAAAHRLGLQSVTLSAGQAAAVGLDLGVEGVLNGTVRDSATVLEGALMLLRSETNAALQFLTVSDADGAYRFDGVPPGDYALVSRAADHVTQVLRHLTIVAGTQSQDVSLAAASVEVRGTIRSAGRALSGVRITATDAAGFEVASAFSAADGTYLLAELTTGSYSVVAAALGFQLGAPAALNVSGSVAAVDFALSPVGMSDIVVNNRFPTVPSRNEISAPITSLGPTGPQETIALGKAGADNALVQKINAERSEFELRRTQLVEKQAAAQEAFSRVSDLLGDVAALRNLSGTEGAADITNLLDFEMRGSMESAINRLYAQEALGPLADPFGGVLNSHQSRDAISRLTEYQDSLNRLRERVRNYVASEPTAAAAQFERLDRLYKTASNLKKRIKEQAADIDKVLDYVARMRALNYSLKRLEDNYAALKKEFPASPEEIQTERERRRSEQQKKEKTLGKSVEGSANTPGLGQPSFCPSPSPSPGPSPQNLVSSLSCGCGLAALDGDGTCPPSQASPLANRVVTLSQIIAASRDPNDLTGPAGYGPDGYLRPATMAYRADFENDPRLATAAAQIVVITLTLDADLDPDSFEFTGFGFGRHNFTIPAGLSHYETTVDLRPDGVNLLVPVVLDLNRATGLIRVQFSSLDPLTRLAPDGIDDGFLPVNNANHDGEGYFTFQVRPKEDRPSGTSIDLQASIVFDDNEAILTPTAHNRLDRGTPDATVSALPARASSPSFLVSWSGSDDAGGSGVAFYDLYVSTDDGPLLPFLLGTPDTSLTFDGEFGRRYAFSVVATDNVGQREASALQVEAATATPGPVTDDSFAVTKGKVLTVFAPGVLANDGPTLTGTRTVVLVAGPQRGKLTLNADGSFSYKLRLNAKAPDSFTYRVEDGVGGTSAVATVSLVPAVQFATTGVSKSEKVTTVKVPVKLSIASTQDVTVSYAVVGGSATSNEDYLFAAGVLTIPAGFTSGKIFFVVGNDRLHEASETIRLALSDPLGARLGGRTEFTYTIVDNDPAPVLRAAAFAPDEDALTAMAISLLLGRSENGKHTL